MARRRKPLINDPRAPTYHKVKLPSGKVVRLKVKQRTDKGRWDTEMREQFLNLIREGLTNRDAAAACGCSTTYMRNRREADPDFEKAYQEAREDGNDVIRAEIKRRAIDGVKTQIYHDGKVVGHRQVYSDPLLMFLAKSRMDEFKDSVSHDHTVKFDGATEGLIAKFSQILGIPADDDGVLQVLDGRGGDPSDVPLAVLGAAKPVGPKR